METVSKTHPLHKLRAKPKKFLQAARQGMEEKGSVGSFTAEAKHKGESTQELASENYNKPGEEGQESAFCLPRGTQLEG
jgi:hypothetical protein